MPKSAPLDLKVPPSRWIPIPAMATKIAVSYAVLGGLWILCSGWVLHRFVQDPTQEALLETFKGWFFVLVTAGLLWLALARYSREIRQSAQLLHESEQHYRLLAENAEDFVGLLDAQENRLYVSPSFFRVTGWTAEEVMQSAWDARLHPDDIPLIKQTRVANLAGQTTVIEHRIRCRDGSWMWVEARCKPMSGPDGQATHLLNWQHDVTERKRAEESLRQRVELQDQLAKIATTVPGMICSFRRRADGTFCMPFATPAIEQLYGLRAQDVAKDFAPVLALIHPEDAASLNESIATSARTMEPWQAVFRVRHPEKGERWVEGRSMPTRETDGSILWHGYVHDITEQKKTEMLLQESLLFRREAEKIGRTGAWKVSPETDYLYWTEGVYGILELPLDYKPGLQEWLKFYDADSIPVLREALKKALVDGTPFMVEAGVTTSTGRHMWTEVRGLGRVGDDKEAFVMGTFQDITERKEAEGQLRRLSRAVEQNPTSIVIADTQGAIEYVNPKFTQTTGYSLAQVRGSRFWEIQSGDMPTEHHQRLWTTISRGQEWRGEFRSKKKNGELYWDLASISPITDTKDKVTHFVIVSEDITERKRLEAVRQVLLSLGNKLNGTADPLGAGRALLEAADQLWKWDSATLDVIAADNHRVEPVLGVDIIDGERRELPRSELHRHTTPRMQRIMKNGAELILRDSTRVPVIDSVLIGDATRPSASVMCVPIRRETRTVGILSIQSYTPHAYTPEDLQILQALADYCGGALDRIRAAEALRHGEERYRGLVETSFDWIWEVDAEGRFTYASPKVRDLLGYAPEEVLGRTAFDLMPESEAQRIRAHFRQTALKREPFSALENINRHKDGHEVVLESSGVPVLGPNGEMRGYRGMDRDITERKRLEAQLRQAQKLEAVGQLAGGVAHDFNNILAAIMMHLGLLQMNTSLDEETRYALKELDAQARRAASLTRQLLMFSRRSVLAVKPLDLNEVVANLLKMLTRLIGEQIDLRFDGKSALPLVEADDVMMEQVLMNLVVNARDAMPKGGRLTISTTLANVSAAHAAANPNRRVGRFVCLAVSDTGCGMDAAMLKRIFEPFFTTKEAGKGTGLGLATVHGIVAQHKGWVEVDSEVSVGTTFRVYLPAAAQAQGEAAPAPQTEPVRRGRETVLLVEDELPVRQIVARSLRALGYQVHEAGNGQEAMALWQTHGAQVDLLLTDMVMPEGMTGLELAEQLQALKPGLKAIISSGYSAEMVEAGVPTKAGIVYLPKPYATRVLANVIRDCMDQKK